MRYFFQLAAAAAVLSLSQVHGSLFDGNNNDSFSDYNDTQWYVNTQFLWWKAVEDNLPVAVVIDSAGLTDSASILKPKFKWDPGFRIGVGYQPCDCDWDFYASWTHFDTKAKRSFGPGSATETIAPEWGTLTPFAASAAALSSKWHLHLNWADFELNHSFCVSSCFKFGIHAGLRGAWINQKFNFSLADGASPSNSLSSKSDYSSVGVVAGLNASWLFGCGLSINASAGGAILYGRQHSKVSESVITDGITSSTSASDHYWISRAMTDFRLGLGWEGCVWEKTIILGVDWEHHILFDQNRFPRGSATASSRPRDGDLTVQGATFTASLLF